MSYNKRSVREPNTRVYEDSIKIFGFAEIANHFILIH